MSEEHPANRGRLVQEQLLHLDKQRDGGGTRAQPTRSSHLPLRGAMGIRRRADAARMGRLPSALSPGTLPHRHFSSPSAPSGSLPGERSCEVGGSLLPPDPYRQRRDCTQGIAGRGDWGHRSPRLTHLLEAPQEERRAETRGDCRRLASGSAGREA